MRCAPSLQSLKLHFSFLGGMPPRMGSAMCTVDEDGRSEDMGEVAVRCLPAWTRRISVVGAEVRRERSWRRVGIVVSVGMVRGITGGGLLARAEVRGG